MSHIPHVHRSSLATHSESMHCLWQSSGMARAHVHVVVTRAPAGWVTQASSGNKSSYNLAMPVNSRLIQPYWARQQTAQMFLLTGCHITQHPTHCKTCCLSRKLLPQPICQVWVTALFHTHVPHPALPPFHWYVAQCQRGEPLDTWAGGQPSAEAEWPHPAKSRQATHEV